MIVGQRDKEPKRPHVLGVRALENTGLTIIHPFYNEPERFLKQLELWKDWEFWPNNNLNVILIDDCSPSPVHTWIDPNIKVPFNLFVYRITTDLKWNTPGALNLGVVVAPTEFILFLDSDCGLESCELKKFLKAKPRENFIYKFKRKRIGNETEDIKNTRFLPCAMLMHKNIFFDIGGFDEDFTGSRSGGYAFFDTDFDHRIEAHFEYNWGVWRDPVIVEWMPSEVGDKVKRKVSDEKHNRKLMYKKQNGEVLRNKEILRFEWIRTFYYKRMIQ